MLRSHCVCTGQLGHGDESPHDRNKPKYWDYEMNVGPGRLKRDAGHSSIKRDDPVKYGTAGHSVPSLEKKTTMGPRHIPHLLTSWYVRFIIREMDGWDLFLPKAVISFTNVVPNSYLYCLEILLRITKQAVYQFLQNNVFVPHSSNKVGDGGH